MKLVAFSTSVPITHFGSHGATIGGVAHCRGETRLSLLELEPGGVLGLHPAASPQLLLVIEGSGRVRSGAGEPEPIGRGTGAFWAAGEPHETMSERGLTAIVVEAESLELL